MSQNGAEMAGKVRHLKERNGRYSARLVVPKPLRHFVGKAELELQLGADRRQALAKLPGAVATLQHKIGLAERRASAAIGKPVESGRYPLSLDQIAVRHYHGLVEFDTEIRHSDHRYAGLEIDDMYAAELRAGMAGKLTDDALDELVGYRIERFRLRGNTDVVKGTPAWRELAIKLCVAEYEALTRVTERNEGDFTGKPEHPLIANAEPATDEPAPVYLRTLLDSYLKELERNGRGAGARKRWPPVFEDLSQFVGHRDAARLTRQNLLDWRDAKLQKLSPKTVADVYMASVRAVLTWAVDNDRLSANPAAGVKVKKTKRIRTREKGFRDEEAVAILKVCRAYVPTVPSNPSNREAPQTTAAKKWASLLCAFTGARIVEITQLRKQDVRQEGNVTVIRITPEAGSVKSFHYRDVPLHQQVIDLGFLDFVKGAPDGPLFHAAKADKALQGARTTAGRVTEWLQSLGVIPEGVPPTHAWRHRLKTIGREAEISDRVLDAIQGHAARTAGDNYGDVTIAAKKKALDKLPFYNMT
jgi:integrase